jgi:hypothetical protein
MEESKINQFALLHGDKFSMKDLVVIKERLSELDDSKFSFIAAQDYNKPSTLFWVSFFLGIFGVDRFMIGHTGLGLAKLFFSWLTLGIWCLVDWLFFIKKATKATNFEKFQMAAML